ncbi:MAG: sulfatase-like hydrolase/transferase, partial [Muribaculaceae bacterium]
AADGMCFTNGYAAASISSPTRCSLMTGKYPARLHITDWIPGYQYGKNSKQLSKYKMISPEMQLNMPLEEVTIAEAMKENGYKTCHVGKWHCAEDSLFYPQYQGFDKNIGGWLSGSPKGNSAEGNAYFTPYNNPYLSDGPKGEFLTDRLGNEAISWISSHKENPFFMYLSFYAVHTPIQPKPEKATYFREKAKRMGIDTISSFTTNVDWYNNHPQPSGHWKERIIQNDANYAALISSMDDNIGKVIDYLKKNGLYDNTIICFLSDNGGLSTAEGSPTTNAPLRGGKGWLYEGGIRVPFLIRYPGITKPGSKCETPVISTDFYPTILSSCGLSMKPEQHKDGVDLLPLLKGKSIKRDAIYWHYPHYGGKGDSPASAIRKGNWKLIQFYETGNIELYNLKDDISESNNLASKHRKLAKNLQKELQAWLISVDAKMPKENKDYKFKNIDSIKILSNIRRQKIAGWGTSLSWWAHDVGDKFSKNLLDTFAYLLTSPKELNMNIFRYNISGGDNPSHTHMRKDAQVPGYKNAEDSAYNWNADSSQRRMLFIVDKLRPGAIYEAANYSPPFWMTKSGCSAGSIDGTDNLKDDYYDDFAKYLADCVSYYKTNYGITFKTISPINEPFSNWWKANGSQEGCAFNVKNQERIITELYKELKDRDMLKYTSIAVMDANSLDECIEGLNTYLNDDILKYIGQINTHSYFGSKRVEIAEFAKKHKIRLWQSESGPLNIKKRGLENFIGMGKRIVSDVNELQSEAWCDWQYMGSGFGGVWSLLGYDVKNQTFQPTKGFYCRKQFSNFIKVGYTIIGNTDENTLTAISPDNKTLIIVMVNEDKKDKIVNIDIDNYDAIVASMYRTSENENCNKIDFKAEPNKYIKLKGKSITTMELILK